MFGAPTSIPTMSTGLLWEPGFGAPSHWSEHTYTEHDSGFGHPSLGRPSDAHPLALPPFVSFRLAHLRHEFGDDGGSTLTLRALTTFPSRGPYRVRLVDAAGKFWPPLSQPGCYSRQAGQGEQCWTNRSQEYLSCALPELPQGAYALHLEWAEGLCAFTSEPLLLVVPAHVCLEAATLQKAFA